jgi:hypothetical protein
MGLAREKMSVAAGAEVPEGYELTSVDLSTMQAVVEPQASQHPLRRTDLRDRPLLGPGLQEMRLR